MAQLNAKSIFGKALEIEEAEKRAAYLDQVCGVDQGMKQEVEALLRAFTQAGDFLSPSTDTVHSAAFLPVMEEPGTMIGPYKLLQQIGVGGMGIVFMAEQTQPVQRKVALKIIKPGMDCRQVIARFEAERQALAIMDHVNIARVYDGGATEAGRPYFVMELVHGVPITKYCDDNHLTPRERLELFVPVCQAIQHAHQKGIIHRDIKPSNVMVNLYDGKPVPKVIDFGVAKATEQKLTEQTLFTQYGTMVGTLEYMSPEQAEMSALGVDTRSDIFSLGVLLYELLTGNTPLTHKRLKEAAFGEILRLIQEEEAPKPSTRLSDSGEALASISALRHTEPAKLSKLMRGELDWIVMKTLEKDRNRRYETANGLAQEVQRYLNDEPVLACPPSALYRLQKFARRNKRSLAFAMCLLLMVAVLTGSLGWVIRDRALRQKDLEREVNRALGDAEQLQAQLKWPEALAATRRAQGVLAGTVINPEIQHRIDDFEADLVMVLRLEEVHGQPGLPDFHTGVELDAGYAMLFQKYGIDIEKLGPKEAAERIRDRSIRQQLAMALDDWAGMRKRKPGDQSWKKLVESAGLADPDEWRNSFRRALLSEDRNGLVKMAESVPIKQLTPATLHLLGNALCEVGAVDKGMNLLHDAQQRYPGDLWLNDSLGSKYLWLMNPPRLDEALRYYTAALAVRPDNYRLHDMVGQILCLQKSFKASLSAASRAIELRPGDSNCWIQRAKTYHAMGQLDLAIADCSKVIELDQNLATGWSYRGFFYFHMKQRDKAIADYTKALELNPKAEKVWNNRGIVYGELNQIEKAFADYSKALELEPKLVEAWVNRGGIYCDKLGQPDNAIADFSQAILLDPKCANAWHNRGVAKIKLGHFNKAVSDFSQAIELDTKYADAWLNRGVAYDKIWQVDKAIADFRQAIRLKPDYVLAHRNLGATLARKGRIDEAIAAYKKAIRIKPNDSETYSNLGILLAKQGKLSAAGAAYREALRLNPEAAETLNNLAWLLATCPEVRDQGQAVDLAKKAVRLNPKLGSNWNTFGVTQYRAGDWKAAVTALEKSIELQKGGGANDWFFLAMSHWQMDQKNEARKWYDQADQWMEKHVSKDEELIRFRTEATALLGIVKKKD